MMAASLARGLCHHGLKLSQNSVIKQSAIQVRCMSEGSRLHSTDIAFKPAQSGWGGGGKYANNFDAIFKKKEGTNNTIKEQATNKNEDKQSDE